jgi:hypothetical protein
MDAFAIWGDVYLLRPSHRRPGAVRFLIGGWPWLLILRALPTQRMPASFGFLAKRGRRKFIRRVVEFGPAVRLYREGRAIGPAVRLYREGRAIGPPEV